jgi:hypothetical protein
VKKQKSGERNFWNMTMDRLTLKNIIWINTPEKSPVSKTSRIKYELQVNSADEGSFFYQLG